MRKPRQLRDGARYHVTVRTNRRELILDSDSMKELFLGVMKRAKAKYRFQVENFCLMGNHVHLIIRPGKGESLSAIMRWILSVFAMTFNRVMHYTGHVWGDRFFSRIITDLRDYLRVFSYIDENPVLAHQTSSKAGWRYGGLWHDQHGYRVLVDEHEPWLFLQFPDHLPFFPFLLT